MREPLGIVARIVPYNHPLMFAATRIALPLLAGNAVVLKAPDQAPLSTLRLGELLTDVLPRGVLSVLSGPGALTGDAIVTHPEIRRIGFIGSPATGRGIQRRAAETGVKHVTLELGGKNPMIIFADVEPRAAAAAAVEGMNFRMTAGQSCGSTSRLFVHESIYTKVLAHLKELVQEIRLGSPTSVDSEMGPLISRSHVERVAALVDNAVANGATLVTGGGRPDAPDLADGTYYLPTVLADVDPAAPVACEEVFGPVLIVSSWREETEVFDIANSLPLGLTASVWTNNQLTAHRAIRRLDAGYVWVNTASRHMVGLPFGGNKDSGIGREECVEELLSYTKTKSVCIDLIDRSQPNTTNNTEDR
jgi:2-formylbenzoate dehydrogenase